MQAKSEDAQGPFADFVQQQVLEPPVALQPSSSHSTGAEHPPKPRTSRAYSAVPRRKAPAQVIAAPASGAGSAPLAEILQKVSAVAQSVLGAPMGEQQPLMEAGLDSLGAVELRNALTTQFGIELPATLTLDYPTVAALADFIAAKISSPATDRSLPTAQDDALQGISEVCYCLSVAVPQICTKVSMTTIFMTQDGGEGWVWTADQWSP